MKLSAREATAYFANPDQSAAGLLIFGADAMRVAIKRQDTLAKLLGPGAEEEMRLSRIPASELRSDKALLLDAVKAVGFFPGPRAAFVEDAGDGLAPIIAEALKDWQPGDAQIIVTAPRQLAAKSALRKLFEADKRAYCVGIYDDPPSRAEIEETLRKSGVTDIDRDASSQLTALATQLDPGDFRQTVEKLALYKIGDPKPVSVADVTACAPATIEAGMDDIINAAAEGQIAQIGPLMQKLSGQGVAPVTLPSWRCATSARCIPPRSTPAGLLPASGHCVRRSLAPDATGWPDRPDDGGHHGWNKPCSFLSKRTSPCAPASRPRPRP